MGYLTVHPCYFQDQIGNRETKEYFDTFCEDYNTATLPSDKYYNIAKWCMSLRVTSSAHDSVQVRLEASPTRRNRLD